MKIAMGIPQKYTLSHPPRGDLVICTIDHLLKHLVAMDRTHTPQPDQEVAYDDTRCTLTFTTDIKVRRRSNIILALGQHIKTWPNVVLLLGSKPTLGRRLKFAGKFTCNVDVTQFGQCCFNVGPTSVADVEPTLTTTLSQPLAGYRVAVSHQNMVTPPFHNFTVYIRLPVDVRNRLTLLSLEIRNEEMGIIQTASVLALLLMSLLGLTTGKNAGVYNKPTYIYISFNEIIYII